MAAANDCALRPFCASSLSASFGCFLICAPRLPRSSGESEAACATLLPLLLYDEGEDAAVVDDWLFLQPPAASNSVSVAMAMIVFLISLSPFLSSFPVPEVPEPAPAPERERQQAQEQRRR